MNAARQWTREALAPDRLRFRSAGGHSVAGTLDGWRDDDAFVSGFASALADAPFPAFLWETPPMTTDTLDDAFEFVIIECPALETTPDYSPFRNQLETAGSEGVARFPNLSGDATLIVPRPDDDAPDWAHLAAFARSAPDGLQRRLWRAVAHAVAARLGPEPIWLSTSGLGVAWLHVRIDERPKYYAHEPYKRAPDPG